MVEVGFHFICRRLLAHSSDKDLLSFVRLAFRLGSGVLGVDLLAIETMRGHGEDSVNGVWVGEGDETKTAASLQRNCTLDFG